MLRDAELGKALGTDRGEEELIRGLSTETPRLAGTSPDPQFMSGWSTHMPGLDWSLRSSLSGLQDGEAMAVFPGKGRELRAQILTGLLSWSKGLAGCFSALASGMK